VTLSLNIGSGPIALLQNGPYVNTGTGGAGPSVGVLTLNAPSTAGTALIAIVAAAPGGGASPSVTSFPVGWGRLQTVTQSNIALLEIWAYPNNPGGISTVNFIGTSTLALAWRCHMSEWANVAAVGYLETSGTATATAGTTLAPTTSGNVVTAGDLAISAWIQQIAVGGVVTFTTPGGFTRLIDSGAEAGNPIAHIDAEYEINPGTGAPLGPTLTSTGTTSSAAGAIVVLKAAPPVADQSAYLDYDSFSLKLNTLDFNLVDCPTIQQPMSTVTLSSPGEYPDWVGTVANVRAVNRTNLPDGHQIQTISATNTQLPNFTNAPYDLTDNPSANTEDVWGLENGDTWGLENGAAEWGLESSVQEDTYLDLSIGSQVGATSPAIRLTTLGYVTVYRPGMWPGMTFKLTSSNLASWITAPGSLYTIQSIEVRYRGAPPVAFYELQFGDLIQTLAEWTAAQLS
jgi:hypothetical protein